MEVIKMNNVNQLMVEAFARRCDELRLTLNDLVDRSGLTRQGIANVKNGHERHYHKATIYGIAEALEWEPDWYDRLRAGKKPKPAISRSDDGPRSEVGELRRAVRELLLDAKDRERRIADYDARFSALESDVAALTTRLVRLERSSSRQSDA